MAVAELATGAEVAVVAAAGSAVERVRSLLEKGTREGTLDNVGTNRWDRRTSGRGWEGREGQEEEAEVEAEAKEVRWTYGDLSRPPSTTSSVRVRTCGRTHLLHVWTPGTSNGCSACPPCGRNTWYGRTAYGKEKKKSVNRHMRRTATYTAGEGDTLGGIAAKYKTTCEDLIELNPQLAERRVQLGEELQVPVGGSRKMSRGPKDTTNFLQGLSISLLEEDDDTEGAEIAETKCLINSDVDFGPRTVTNGYLMLDSGSLTLSWAREDPLTLTQEDITNIALIYGPVELPEFISLLDRNEYNHSAGHR